MATPLCPTCQESLSGAEFGLGGMWSCLYCEATWLPWEQAQGIALEPSLGGAELGNAKCPCGGTEFSSVQVASRTGWQCSHCKALLLPKGVVQVAAPELISHVLTGRSTPEQVAKAVAADLAAGTVIAGVLSIFN